MSQIGWVWRVVGPMLLGHPFVVAAGVASRTALRLLSACVAAAVCYALTLLVAIELYPSDRPLAGLCYGAGFAAATWLGACAGALSARPNQRRLVANAAAVLAMVLPLWLAVQAGIAGERPTVYLLYVTGAGAGGLAAVRLFTLTAPGRDRAAQA